MKPAVRAQAISVVGQAALQLHVTVTTARTIPAVKEQCAMDMQQIIFAVNIRLVIKLGGYQQKPK